MSNTKQSHIERLQRIIEEIQAGTSILGKMVSVLDKGSIECIDFMGRDSDIVSDARVSRLGKSMGEKKDKGLLRRLVRDGHTTPLEMVWFKVEIFAPVVFWWHIIRHRHMSLTMQSGRYTEYAEDSVYIPIEWRLQSTSNKQASEGLLDPEQARMFTAMLREDCARGFAHYQQALAAGIAREQARLFLLAWGTYYRGRMSVNALSMMNMIRLRCAADAQHETRMVVNALRDDFYIPHLAWLSEIQSELKG